MKEGLATRSKSNGAPVTSTDLSVDATDGDVNSSIQVWTYHRKRIDTLPLVHPKGFCDSSLQSCSLEMPPSESLNTQALGLQGLARESLSPSVKVLRKHTACLRRFQNLHRNPGVVCKKSDTE